MDFAERDVVHVIAIVQGPFQAQFIPHISFTMVSETIDNTDQHPHG